MSKNNTEYRVVPLEGHSGISIIKACIIMSENAEFLNSRYASDFYKNIIRDCNIVLENGGPTDDIKGIRVTSKQEPFLLKKSPTNTCFLAMHDL